GDLANIVRGASPRPIQDSKWFDKESDIGWLRISDVTEQNGRIYHLEQHISKLGQEKTRVLTEPHLLLSIAATVGKPLVNYVKTGVHDGFLIFLDPLFEREFMFQWFEMYRPQWKKYGQPGSQVNLNSELIRNQDISIPGNAEQQKIGSFFKQLDNLITQNGRKVDLLKQLKQAYLQKIFSQELRFAGFHDTWEQRKIEELGDVVRTGINPQNYLKEQFAEYSMPAYDDGQRPQIVLGSSMQSSRLTISGNVLLINKLNVRQKRVWLVSDALENSVASGEFMPFTSSNVDLSFMRQLILSDKTTRDFEAMSSGTSNSQKRITPTDFLNYVISIPTSKIEQKRIGDIFDEMDKLITLNQQKVNLLKKQKQAFLQKMFI
ncbi:restriction endonuclease subunit S, partial [Leuconostoc falkenbergense]|uniref:restriction endonuclease subunit S n=1 Tax=Leuconostoc falkenbergense TaxID=2766470 RepID=UPI0024A9788A